MDEKDPTPSPSTVLTEISLQPGERIALKAPHWTGYVTIVDICEDKECPELKTRLGLVIPIDIPVHRKEVFDLIHA